MVDPSATRPIEAKGLRLVYRRSLLAGIREDVVAIDSVDLDLDAGEVVGVLGPNGSGKSSLFRILAGEVRPTAGTARILGRPATDPELVRSVGYQPEGPMPFANLSGRDVLRHLARLSGLPGGEARERADHWLERLGMSHAARRPVRGYSTGMRRRTAIAAALLTDPEVLILDEPTSGLDPQGSELVLQLVRERADQGGTVLLASHHLQEIEEACDRAVLLVDGNIVEQGPLDTLLGNDERALVLREPDEQQRQAIERAARDSGAETIGWRRGRRHLFALFREWTTRSDEPDRRGER